MRLCLIVTLASALSFTACSYKSTSSETTTSGPTKPTPVPPKDSPLDLLRGSETYKSSGVTKVEQTFASLSVNQINAAKASQIDFVESVSIPSNPEIQIEVEYEKADASGVATETYPAALGGDSKIEGTKLILPGLRFNIPATVNSNSRKQTLKISANALQVVIPLKTPRLQFCTSPLAAETQWSQSSFEKGAEGPYQTHTYVKHFTDLTLENMVTCGLTVTARELQAVGMGGGRLNIVNPIRALKISNPDIEIRLDGKLQDLEGEVPQYDGSAIKLKLPMRFAVLPARTMEVRAVDPDNRERYVSYTIYLVPKN
ncbi:MAG: hypothetical protein ACXVA9_01915 [Bdellovibrionales bacterium]